MLVSSNCQLSSTIVEPLVFLKHSSVFFWYSFSILLELFCPVVVYSEPEDTHSQQEGILISSRVSNSCVVETEILKLMMGAKNSSRKVLEGDLLQKRLTSNRE